MSAKLLVKILENVTRNGGEGRKKKEGGEGGGLVVFAGKGLP